MEKMADTKALRIVRLGLGLFATNSYIITCKKTSDSVIVDAPAEAGRIEAELGKTNPRYILLTHNHSDHTQALEGLRGSLGIPLAAHRLDSGNLPAPPEITLEDGDSLAVGALKLAVIHTPGHTPGSLCFMLDKYLISGDTIFPGGPGKTGAPADFRRIVQSITEKIFTLPEDTLVYPGHGESTVLKKEKAEFAAFSERRHSPGLCGDVLWRSS